jgi:hypothetical protein
VIPPCLCCQSNYPLCTFHHSFTPSLTEWPICTLFPYPQFPLSIFITQKSSGIEVPEYYSSNLRVHPFHVPPIYSCTARDGIRGAQNREGCHRLAALLTMITFPYFPIWADALKPWNSLSDSVSAEGSPQVPRHRDRSAFFYNHTVPLEISRIFIPR